ncbi:MAG: hypothetical protein ACYDHN_03645 [Solirubrobacteraceae bacterium]
MIEVRDLPELDRLERRLLGDRETASVILTQREDSAEPVLPPQKVRDVVGSDSLIYFVAGDRQLRKLRVTLGAALAPTRGSLRIYWPGVKLKADPLDHPAVAVLLDEPVASSLEELARQFDLSRPRVRQEIKYLDDLRRKLEQDNSRLTAELRRFDRRPRQSRTSSGAAEA